VYMKKHKKYIKKKGGQKEKKNVKSYLYDLHQILTRINALVSMSEMKKKTKRKEKKGSIDRS